MGKEHRERLRKRAAENFESLQQHEVLELMLFFSYARIDTNPIGHALMDKFGSIYNVCNASREELIEVFNVGEKAADFITTLPKFVRAYEQSMFDEKAVFQTTDALGRYAVALLFGRVNEAAYVICLDANCRMIKCPKIAEGTAGEVHIEPRMVMEQVIHTATRSVVLCHNHPAGTLVPSESDLNATEKIRKALETIDVTLSDHIIVANGNYLSMRQENYRF